MALPLSKLLHHRNSFCMFLLPLKKMYPENLLLSMCLVFFSVFCPFELLAEQNLGETVIQKTGPYGWAQSRVLAIDSIAYEDENPRNTNAHTIKRIIIESEELSDLEILPIRATPYNWDPSTVFTLQPKLVFLHWSAFERGPDDQCSIRGNLAPTEPCHRLMKNLRELLVKTHSSIVIYTRTSDACGDNNLSLLMDEIAAENSNSFKSRVYLLELSSSLREVGGFASESAKSDVRNITKILTSGGTINFNDYDGICPVE